MADKKTADESQPDGAKAAPTNYQDQVSNQETSIRDAKPDEKPDPSTVAQVEEIKD